LRPWFTENVDAEWPELVSQALALLQEEMELLEIVQLVGPDALAEAQREVLLVARMLREDFLQQSAFDQVDRFCPLAKACWMLRVILTFHGRARAFLNQGIPLATVASLPVIKEIGRMKEWPPEKAMAQCQLLVDRIKNYDPQ
jgi:V/A-type H+-transporting ATPase subunit A